jgi:hypothetical protein
MNTKELKAKLCAMYPTATRIRVRSYPITYKGSMRGYTTVDVVGINGDFKTERDRIKSIVPEPAKTFIDVMR